MFNFNIITAEQPSVDFIDFTMECYGQVSDYLDNFLIDSMLTKNDRCCLRFAFLLNNHIKIINMSKCSLHVLYKDIIAMLQNMIVAKWIKLATKCDMFTP